MGSGHTDYRQIPRTLKFWLRDSPVWFRLLAFLRIAALMEKERGLVRSVPCLARWLSIQ